MRGGISNLKNLKQRKDSSKNINYNNNTVIFNSYNSGKDIENNTFLTFSKIMKIITLFTSFISIILMVFAYSKISDKITFNSNTGRNHKELIIVPLLTFFNTVYIGLLIKNSIKKTSTYRKKNFSMIMYCINIFTAAITSLLLIFMDISSALKWSSLFLFIFIVETSRIILIYFILFYKTFKSKNLFPIDLAKTKRMIITLISISVPLFLYLYVSQKHVYYERVSLIMFAMLVIFSITSIFVILIAIIWVSKLDDQSGSLMQEEEQQSTTFINYMISIITAPFIGLFIANIKYNIQYNHWVIIGIILSTIMIISYLTLIIIDYKKLKEFRRTPILNSIIMLGYLFANTTLMMLLNILTINELERWNYAYLIILGTHTLFILLITILFNVEMFKYFINLKTFIIGGAFILIMFEIIVLSMVINNKWILTLYNAEIVTILFSTQFITVSLLLFIELVLMAKWTNIQNKTTNKEISG